MNADQFDKPGKVVFTETSRGNDHISGSIRVDIGEDTGLPPDAVLAPPPAPAALNVQVGGSHYKDMAIQPVEFIHANGIPYLEGNVIKYLTRWRKKNGIADLEKARHYIDLLIELESRNA